MNKIKIVDKNSYKTKNKYYFCGNRTRFAYHKNCRRVIFLCSGKDAGVTIRQDAGVTFAPAGMPELHS